MQIMHEKNSESFGMECGFDDRTQAINYYKNMSVAICSLIGRLPVTENAGATESICRAVTVLT